MGNYLKGAESMRVEKSDKILTCGYSFLIIFVVMLLYFNVGIAAADESAQYYKIISTVEYAGSDSFRNQVETELAVTKQTLADNRVMYSLASETGKNWTDDGQTVM